MTAFVESCVQTAAGSAVAAQRHARGQPQAQKLLKVLAERKKILVTTHQHPDPDALASGYALAHLLRGKLKDATITFSVKGAIPGGINEAFIRYANLNLAPWDDAALKEFDAIVLLDVQPVFAYSPLPHGVMPTAIIDHHRPRGQKPQCPFCDIRSDVGATSSIVFSYFMELEVPISPDLGATLLYAIESDLAGAAGTPTELDNIALSSLTLLADTHKLYQMRYVDLPQSYYTAYAAGLQSAVYYDDAMTAHIDTIDSLEKPAVIADFLLRFDKVRWSLVSAIHGNRMILSLRSSDKVRSAGDVMRKLVRGIGEGGGHRAKAGGYVSLQSNSAAEIERHRTTLRRRLLRALGIQMSRGQKLVPHVNDR
jgi:nanoRNase/pAp phosphatase (c-di-AMP/oligoRNAs hydrolase)